MFSVVNELGSVEVDRVEQADNNRVSAVVRKIIFMGCSPFMRRASSECGHRDNNQTA